MEKITLTLTVSYTFSGQLLKDYLEWLDDYKDTPKTRLAFAKDRFVPIDLVDPKAKLRATIK